MIEKARLKHRILSVMLAVVMVLSMVPISPMTALAADSFVAEVGGTSYATLDDAVAAAEMAENSTLTLLTNIDLGDAECHINSGKFTIDLNNKVLNGNVWVAAPASITIMNTGTVNGTVTAAGENAEVTIVDGTFGGAFAQSGSVMNILGGTFNGSSCGASCNTATLDISGGLFEGTIAVDCYNGELTITGGTLKGENYDLDSIGESTVVLGVGESGTGATFPGGIQVTGVTLANLLAVDTAYFDNDQRWTYDADSYSIDSSGEVVVKTFVCLHENASVVPAEFTHTVSCAECGYNSTENHTTQQDENKATCVKTAVCDLCGVSYGEVDPDVHTYANGYCTGCNALETYNLYVGGVKVNYTNASDILGDGTARFDPETYTLTLDSAQIVGSVPYVDFFDANIGAGVLHYSDKRLTVNVVGNNYVSGGLGGGCSVGFFADADFVGDGSLTLDFDYNADVMAAGILGDFTVSVNTKLNALSCGGNRSVGITQYTVLGECTLDGDVYIFDDDTTSNPESGWLIIPEGSVLIIPDGKVLTVLNDSGDKNYIRNDGTIILQGTGTIKNAGTGYCKDDDSNHVWRDGACLVCHKTCICDIVDDVCTNCGMQYFDIFVAGTEITSANAADVLGDGTISYDAASNTLTLNGANIDTSLLDNYIPTVQINRDLNLRLLGDNALTCKKYEMHYDDEISWLGVAGIELNNGAVITITANSTGALSVLGCDGGFADGCDIFTFSAIAGDGGLVVNGGTLTCGDQSGHYGGVRLSGDVVINGGTVEAGFLAGTNVTISDGVILIDGNNGFPYAVEHADGMHGIYASNNVEISGGNVTVNAGTVGVVGDEIYPTIVNEICVTHGLYAGGAVSVSGGTVFVSGCAGGYTPESIGTLSFCGHLLSPSGYSIYAPAYSVSDDVSFTCGDRSHKFDDSGVCEFCGEGAKFCVSFEGNEYFTSSYSHALGLCWDEDIYDSAGTVTVLKDAVLDGEGSVPSDVELVVASGATLQIELNLTVYGKIANHGTVMVPDAISLKLNAAGSIVNNGAFQFAESASFERNGTASCTETATHCYRDGVCIICLVCDHQYENGICARNGCYEPAKLNEAGYYEIGNAGQLLWFADLVNNGSTTINALLTDDIDMTGLTLWTHMTTYGGVFDGNGFCIDGLNKDAEIEDGHRCGFIYTLTSSGVVKNLIFTNADVFYQSEVGVGVIAYNNAGTISQCIVESSVVQLGNYDGLAFISGKNLSGGVIENCAAINCTATRRFGGANSKNMGGITEVNEGTVRNCYTYGSVFNNGGSVVGAVVATGNAPENCFYYTTSTVADTFGTVKTIEQFASGHVAALLGAPFGQNIDNGEANEGWPVISDAAVYEVKDCQNDVVYSNTEGATVHYPFADPTFGWSYDWTACMGLLNCEKCLETVYRGECTVTVDTSDPSKTIYTASFTYKGTTYTNTQEIAKVVSVNISWGAMEFTFTGGEWQPETHTYSEEKWTADEEGGNVITVTNNGEVDVNVTFTYNKTVSEVEGSFTDESGNAITSPVALAVSEEKKYKLILSGKPNSSLDKAPLGSVTVTITLPENQS